MHEMNTFDGWIQSIRLIWKRFMQIDSISFKHFLFSLKLKLFVEGQSSSKMGQFQLQTAKAKHRDAKG